MATVVSENLMSPNRRSYPWDDLLNGEAWNLVLGVDFDNLLSFKGYCYQKARERGLKVKIKLAKDRKSFVMQAVSKAGDDSTEA